VTPDTTKWAGYAAVAAAAAVLVYLALSLLATAPARKSRLRKAEAKLETIARSPQARAGGVDVSRLCVGPVAPAAAEVQTRLRRAADATGVRLKITAVGAAQALSPRVDAVEIKAEMEGGERALLGLFASSELRRGSLFLRKVEIAPRQPGTQLLARMEGQVLCAR
jgi:hypothetical protein